MNSPLFMTDSSFDYSFPSSTWPQRHSVGDIPRVRFPSCGTIYLRRENTDRLCAGEEKLLLLLSLRKRFQDVDHMVCIEMDRKRYLRYRVKRKRSSF